MKRLLLALSAAALSAAVLVPVALGYRGHRVYTPQGGVATRAYRPSVVAISGDASYYVSHVRWSSYNGAQALGRGTSNVDNCDPDCARGHVYHESVVVRLTRPHRTCGVWYYGTIHLFWPGRKPPGKGRHDTVAIGPFTCGG